MAIESRYISSASEDKGGIYVSLEKGKRSESFMNTDTYWFYSAETVLSDKFFEWELTAPYLGELRIFRKPFSGRAKEELIASFPKGSWDFVRLISS